MKHTNIYHVCVCRTASQWFRTFFAHLAPDTRVYNYENEGYGQWDRRSFVDRHVECDIPKNTICSPLYMSFDNYAEIPKPDDYKSFCVWRDPRDVVVSLYFSIRYSHGQIGDHPQWRQTVSQLSKEDGILGPST